MKRIVIVFFMLLCMPLTLTACKNSSVGVIGGADGPTAILVGEHNKTVKGQSFGEQYEKKPIRMFNVDGDLYYDTGLVSQVTARCGTLDANLIKAVDENQIPLKSGQANFDVDGYQHATSITKEVNVDGEWIIFKKYDTFGKTLDGLKYCYYIKGRLNNAASDSEIIVLSEDENITFNDVYVPLLSSQSTAGEGIGRTIHNRILSDKWGITLHADNVTPSGMTLKIEQFGGSAKGQLQTGVSYTLETTVNDKWQSVPLKVDNLVWHLIAYSIKKNDITEFEVDWEFIYGELPTGFYRLKKEIMDFIATGKYEEQTYEVYFTIS